MCLDISFKVDELVDKLEDYLPNLRVDPQATIEFDENPVNIHTQAHARLKSRVIYLNSDGLPYLTYMRWGLLMNYMLDNPEAMKKYGNNMFNARSEEILNPKSTWYRIRKQRCLIDVTGIYEHRAIVGWKKKVPYIVRLSNRKRLLIPALYNFPEKPNPETGEITGTFAMITLTANELMKNIHNDGPNKHRMPLFMQPEQAAGWLEPMTDVQMKAFLSYEIPSNDLNAYPVYTIRNTATRPDGKEKNESYDWPGLPVLGNDNPNEQVSMFA
jgi:putative SOS response-associated peptidase YedK